MRIRKLSALVIVFALVAALGTSAMAADFDLGAFTGPSGADTHNYWFTTSTDDVTTNLTPDVLQGATEIRVEYTEEPAGGVQFVYFGEGNGWDWKSVDFEPNGTSLVIKTGDLSGWSDAVSGDKTKIALGYWSGDLSEIIKSVTVVYSGSSSGGGGTVSNAKTGDGFVIFGVLGILALAACGMFVFRRKAENN